MFLIPDIYFGCFFILALYWSGLFIVTEIVESE